MQIKTLMGGLVLTAGLLAVGCGPTDLKEAGADSNMAQAEQGLLPSCAPGYTVSSEWDCAQVCGRSWGNFLHYYCSNGVDTYDAGTGPVSCGACY
ncbi:MAG: hypothetical protein ACJ8AT_21535 [Hyalangium sp.]|uniref:hypothetical protein n=1 Tax=Hyalangium sp. TaxID=2028555 RepID=UPI003899B7BF